LEANHGSFGFGAKVTIDCTWNEATDLQNVLQVNNFGASGTLSENGDSLSVSSRHDSFPD
jgi:hypothetical protein